MNYITRRRLIKELTKVTTGKHSFTYGLCTVMGAVYYSEQDYFDLRSYMKDWPKYSGAPLYPVPHPELSAGLAYETYMYTGLYDKRTEYGRNRIELAEYLISRLDIKVSWWNKLMFWRNT